MTRATLCRVAGRRPVSQLRRPRPPRRLRRPAPRPRRRLCRAASSALRRRIHRPRPAPGPGRRRGAHPGTGGRPARRPRVHPRPGSPAADVRDLPGRHRGPADRRGPACTDCAGDLPDDGTGADPDRPETWAFAEPAAAEGTGCDTAVPGTRSLATLIADAAAQECTYCHAGLGVPCVTGPDGWHLARFLGVLPGRAEARLVGAAATPHGDMSGIVRDAQPEVTP